MSNKLPIPIADRGKGVSASFGLMDGDQMIATLANCVKPVGGTWGWNKKDNDRVPVPEGSYFVKTLTNRINYDVDPIAVLLNTSPYPNIQGNGDTVSDMVIFRGRKIHTTGNAEKRTSLESSLVDKPSVKITLLTEEDGIGCYLLCCDDNTLYVAGTNYSDKPKPGEDEKNFRQETIMFAIDGDTWGQKKIEHGIPVDVKATQYISCLHLGTGVISIAVQKKGNFLFVNYEGAEGKVAIYDKNTWEFITSFSLTHASENCVDVNENPWTCQRFSPVIKKEELEKIKDIKEDSRFFSRIKKWSKDGLKEELSFDVPYYVLDMNFHPIKNQLWVTDYKDRQVKIYSQEGIQVGAFGRKDGYKFDTREAKDKFLYKCHHGWDQTSGLIAFEPDGKVWLQDTGLFRLIRYDTEMNYISHTQFLPSFYAAQTNRTIPTEDHVLGMQITTNNETGEWTVTHCYSERFAPEDYADAFYVYHPTTIDGITYCVLRIKEDRGRFRLARLTDHGIEDCPFNPFYQNENCLIDKNLNIFVKWNEQSKERPAPLVFNKIPVAGIGEDKWPIYGEEFNLGVSPEIDFVKDKISFLGTGLVGSFHQFPNGTIAEYTGSRSSEGVLFTGYHFVGYTNNKWMFRTMPGTPENFYGPYPLDGRLNLGGGVWEYPGRFCAFCDEHAVIGGNQEGLRGSQLNALNHFYQNGLMLGMGGQWWFPTGKHDKRMVGNTNRFSITKLDEKRLKVIEPTESFGYGAKVFIWEGLDTIQENLVPVEVVHKKGISVELFNNKDLDVLGKTGITEIEDFNFVFPEGVYGVRFSGYIKYKEQVSRTFRTQTDGIAEILIDGVDPVGMPVIFEEEKFYYYSVEVSGRPGTFVEQKVLEERFFPKDNFYIDTDIEEQGKVYNLHAGLNYNGRMKNKHGWNVFPEQHNDWQVLVGNPNLPHETAKGYYAQCGGYPENRYIQRNTHLGYGLLKSRLTIVVTLDSLDASETERNFKGIRWLDRNGYVAISIHAVQTGREKSLVINNILYSELHTGNTLLTYIQFDFIVDAVAGTIAMKAGRLVETEIMPQDERVDLKNLAIFEPARIDNRDFNHEIYISELEVIEEEKPVEEVEKELVEGSLTILVKKGALLQNKEDVITLPVEKIEKALVYVGKSGSMAEVADVKIVDENKVKLPAPAKTNQTYTFKFYYFL